MPGGGRPVVSRLESVRLRRLTSRILIIHGRGTYILGTRWRHNATTAINCRAAALPLSGRYLCISHPALRFLFQDWSSHSGMSCAGGVCSCFLRYEVGSFYLWKFLSYRVSCPNMEYFYGTHILFSHKTFIKTWTVWIYRKLFVENTHLFVNYLKKQFFNCLSRFWRIWNVKNPFFKNWFLKIDHFSD